MGNEIIRMEILEAIRAGERALNSLQKAKDKLNSAKKWGVIDLLGGGFITDVMKHSKMNDASRYIEEAKKDLQIFQRELKDVHGNWNITFKTGGILSFADFFFDGFLADFMMQSKIRESRQQIEDAIYKTETLLNELKKMYGMY